MLKELEQYKFDRSTFVKVIRDNIPNLLDLYDDNHRNNVWRLDNFMMIRNEDEYYILHLDSGTIINWYKNLGRTNTCNKDLSLEEFEEFCRLLKDDIIGGDN